MEDIKLTIFTPTYNRAYCLNRVYESLCRQTVKDFYWLVIDDGSTDNTRSLIEEWTSERKISIDYIFQDNQGMHGAHNTAYKNIHTEYNTCIDSDDYMTDDAVEIILKSVEGLDDRFAGIIGLNVDPSGRIIGNKLPDKLEGCSYKALMHDYKIRGDKKLVYKTKVVNEFPEYPLFKGERFVPLAYLYYLIDLRYKLKPVNEILAIVDYQPDGSTRNIFRQYIKNPRGFAFYRIECMKLPLGFNRNFKNAIHLVSSALFLKDFTLLKKTGRPLLIFPAIPLGVLLNIYIRARVSLMES